jgi:hypothetical protein
MYLCIFLFFCVRDCSENLFWAVPLSPKGEQGWPKKIVAQVRKKQRFYETCERSSARPLATP